MPEVSIIGVAPDGGVSLSPAAREALARAEVIIGGERLLGLFPGVSAEKVAIKNNLAAIASFIREHAGRRCLAVLASGDPGLYGIARYLTEELGKGGFTIIPAVSSVQLAFARIGESWDDAAILSAHGRPVMDLLPELRRRPKAAILTDFANSPSEIARILREYGWPNCPAYVCQDLGTAGEAVTTARLYDLEGKTFSPLNVLILLPGNAPAPRPKLGTPDAAYRQRRAGLITKLEVRAVSLAKLGLRVKSTVWDIGAGSGAVAIEASALAAAGQVYAVERDARAVACIRENIRAFGADRVTVVPGAAPQALVELPDPDAVFIGGSGGALRAIIQAVGRRLKSGGRLVANAATLESLHAAADVLQAHGFHTEVTALNVARSRAAGRFTHLQALNPVFIITGEREEGITRA